MFRETIDQQVYEEIGCRIGWYDIPTEVRDRIILERPNLRPVPYVKFVKGAKVTFGFGWYNFRSADVQRKTRNISNFVVIYGDTEWIRKAIRKQVSDGKLPLRYNPDRIRLRIAFGDDDNFEMVYNPNTGKYTVKCVNETLSPEERNK